MMGEVRFRSHLHFCKSASSVSRAFLGADIGHGRSVAGPAGTLGGVMVRRRQLGRLRLRG